MKAARRRRTVIALGALTACGVVLSACDDKPLDCNALAAKAAQCFEQIPRDMEATSLEPGKTPSADELREHERKAATAKCQNARDDLKEKLRLCTTIDSCDKFAKCLYPTGKTVRDSTRPFPSKR